MCLDFFDFFSKINILNIFIFWIIKHIWIFYSVYVFNLSWL